MDTGQWTSLHVNEEIFNSFIDLFFRCVNGLEEMDIGGQVDEWVRVVVGWLVLSEAGSHFFNSFRLPFRYRIRLIGNFSFFGSINMVVFVCFCLYVNWFVCLFFPPNFIHSFI